MTDEQKLDWQKADYFWDNFSLYGKVKKLKQYDAPQSEKIEKRVNKEALRGALYDCREREEVQRMLKERLCYDNGEMIALSVLRHKDKTYLSDGGGAVRYLRKKYGSEQKKIAEYIARIATTRKICLIGESLCMLLTKENADGTDYGDMISLLWKIQSFGGYGYV